MNWLDAQSIITIGFLLGWASACLMNAYGPKRFVKLAFWGVFFLCYMSL
jgi:hypothetical protein